MDNIANPDIVFNEEGICNYCTAFFENKVNSDRTEKYSFRKIQPLLDQIKSEGKGKKYDCIVGISGGVDSSYLLFKMKELGLRPLAVHCDNGWNSELAVGNIGKLVSELNVDLATFIIDWEEFREIQIAFLKAGVIDVELISDHALAAVLYKYSVKYKTKYIFQGMNNSSEFILPSAWYHWKHDALNIKAIYRKFSGKRIRKYPYLSFFEEYYHLRIRKTKKIILLDYLDYDKAKAEIILSQKFGLKFANSKHNESIFTRFYQNYILPVKFKVDKRKAHLSSLICAKQVSREVALEELKKDITMLPETISDKEYVLKKLNINEEVFNQWMKEDPVSHFAYPSYLTKHGKIFRKISAFFKGK